MLSGTAESHLTDVITDNKKYQPGNFDNTVSTLKIAMFVIQSLTITPFFTDLASLIRVAGRGG